jgi:hypothetical protein
MATNTNVFVAPTVGEIVAYQIQINGLLAVNSNGGLRPAVWIGSLLFDASVGTPDARLKNVVLHELQSIVGLRNPTNIFLKAALPAVYPDVSAAVQVLATGEITLELSAGFGPGSGWSNLVLTVSPEMVLPPGFDPIVAVPGEPTLGPVLKTITIDVPPLSTVTICPAPDPGFVRVTGNNLTGSGLGIFVSAYPFGGTAAYNLLLIDTVFLGVLLRTGTADFVDPNNPSAFTRLVFGSAETLDLQNLDAVNTIRVTTGYIDVPSTGISLIRVATNGTTPVAIVPAPFAGKLRVPFYPDTFENMFSAVVAYWLQRDTVFHTGLLKQLGEVYSGSGTIAPAPITAQGLLLLPVTLTSPITFELFEATVTDEGLIIGAYQDVDA